jgi:hypothetical protein
MNFRWLAVIAGVIFVFALVWNAFVHMVLLRDEANMALDAIARPVADRSMMPGLLLTAGLAVLFVYSYASCVHAPGVKRALGHGAFLGLLAGLLVDLNQFVLYPIPASLALAWFAFGFVEFCIYGVFAAWLYPVDERRLADASA